MKAFQFDIKLVLVAHEFEINEQNQCDYSDGRGSYGLIFCISGNAVYKFTSGESVEIKKGDLMIIGKDAAYRINPPHNFKHYTINFDIHEESSVLPMSREGYYKSSPSNTDDFSRAFKELTKSGELLGDELRDMSTIGKVYGIFGMIAKDDVERKNESGEYRRLSPAKSFIDANPEVQFKLEELALMSDMSVTNFRREWKRIYKNTPLEYRDALRIRIAKKLLTASFKPIVEVAEECGFTDSNYFVRFFKKQTGLTPSEYRRSIAIL